MIFTSVFHDAQRSGTYFMIGMRSTGGCAPGCCDRECSKVVCGGCPVYTNHEFFPMVLSIKKCRDFWSRDSWRTLSIQHGKDRGGREATNRVKEILAGTRCYFGKGGKELSSYFRARQYVVHQLCGFGLLDAQVTSACRLCQSFACTSPEATPVVI